MITRRQWVCGFMAVAMFAPSPRPAAQTGDTTRAAGCGRPCKWPVSTDGGTQPRWRRDGRELFYLAPDRNLMAVTVRPSSTFDPDAPRALFETRLATSAPRHTYAVSADGQRFLMNAIVGGASSAPLFVVLNWPGLLKR